MIILVTGSRTWTDANFVFARLDEILMAVPGLVLVHGACPSGADAHAEAWARKRQGTGANVTVDRYPANWGSYGRAAGILRNAEMVRAVSGKDGRVLAFIRDGSKGASHCVELARRAALDVTVYRWEDRPVLLGVRGG